MSDCPTKHQKRVEERKRAKAARERCARRATQDSGPDPSQCLDASAHLERVTQRNKDGLQRRIDKRAEQLLATEERAATGKRSHAEHKYDKARRKQYLGDLDIGLSQHAETTTIKEIMNLLREHFPGRVVEHVLGEKSFRVRWPRKLGRIEDTVLYSYRGLPVKIVETKTGQAKSRRHDRLVAKNRAAQPGNQARHASQPSSKAPGGS